MATKRMETSEDARADAFDTLTRSLHGQLPRRRAVRLLAAAVATGVFGVSQHSDTEATAAAATW